MAELRVSTFDADVTPKVGVPVAYVPARSITDRLTARGVVLQALGQKPVVLCAIDWIGIGNDAYDRWLAALAQAAGTTPDRVTLHALHQHDAPRWEIATKYLVPGFKEKVIDMKFAEDAMARTAAAVRAGMKQAKPVTQLGVGAAKVEKVASNRRILGPDGKVKYVRYSKSRIPEAIAAPEGVIDPYMRALSFWSGDKPVAVLTYYATHPQSYYGDGDVTAEFVGLARAQRDQEQPGVMHIHFNGASGNVAAGKYNDGSHEMRPVLTARMAAGMKAAWDATEKYAVPAKVDWAAEPVQLPAKIYADRATLMATLNDASAKFETRRRAAIELTWTDRNEAKKPVVLKRLRLGDIQILHMPGELFVEYQLAAQKMPGKGQVLMAAYGDFGPGYIGTTIAYGQGGYEVGAGVSRVQPSVEPVLMDAMRRLLAR